ncbi:hypothetical protein [Paenirhodobacter sp.]|uniref:hypothetical protein n=1 Tax=Paenirhodobacter sp. TaxID=1965326 RepID=UPI003B3DE666
MFAVNTGGPGACREFVDHGVPLNVTELPRGAPFTIHDLRRKQPAAGNSRGQLCGTPQRQ